MFNHRHSRHGRAVLQSSTLVLSALLNSRITLGRSTLPAHTRAHDADDDRTPSSFIHSETGFVGLSVKQIYGLWTVVGHISLSGAGAFTVCVYSMYMCMYNEVFRCSCPARVCCLRFTDR